MSTRKIYFCESITGGRDDVGVYEHIIEELKKYGHVLTDFLGTLDLRQSTRGDQKVLGLTKKALQDKDDSCIISQYTLP
jgi:hypothetical protein